jgi:hypothetical protein
VAVLVEVLVVLLLVVRVVLAVVELLAVRLAVLAIHHQQVHHKVILVAQALVLVGNMVLEAGAVRLLLVLMERLQWAAMVEQELHQAFLVAL